LVALRGHGKTIFAHVADDTGRIQLYFKKDQLGEAFKLVELFDLGDVVGIEGYLFRTRTGEVTVHVTEATMLAKSLRPLPFGKEEVVDGQVVRHSGFADGEQRSRQRYADLAVHPDVRRHFAARSRMTTAIRRALDDLGYLEVETPVLQPLYGGAAARPFTTHHNELDQDMYLRISFELYLKRLLVGNLERVYEIGRDFRNEGVSFKHNPEFTQLEFYWAYADYLQVMELTEQMISYVAEQVTGSTKVKYGEHELEFKPPWKRIEMRQGILDVTGVDINEHKTAEALLKAIKEKQPSAHPDAKATRGKLIDFLVSEYLEP